MSIISLISPMTVSASGPQEEIQLVSLESALIQASGDGDLTAVGQTLEAGADVNHVSPDGFTPLSIAIIFDNFELVKMLVEAGANVNLTTPDELAPLYVATENGNFEISEFLVKAGADVNFAMPSSGLTPLFIAASVGRLDIAKMLVAAGADKNKARLDGVTPLFVALQNEYLGIAEMLLEAGANPYQRLNDDKTLLTIAHETGAFEIIPLIETAQLTYAEKEGRSEILNQQKLCWDALPEEVVESIYSGRMMSFLNQHEINDVDCPICLTHLKDEIIKLGCPCKIGYHPECLRDLAKCPMCRSEITHFSDLIPFPTQTH